MANEDLQLEIEFLRKQLDAIKSEPEDPVSASSPDVEEQIVDESEVASVSSETVSDEKTEDLVSQFRELLDTIDHDIKDTKPTTLLIVFALGVLVGRL
jgi:hypothetical protein